jgi:hypothetical protein
MLYHYVGIKQLPFHPVDATKLIDCNVHKMLIFSLMNTIDALLGPGVNPLEGSPNVKLRKLGPKGTLPASNSRKG